MTLTSAPPGTIHPPLLPVRRPPALEPPCDGDDLVEISAMVGTELPFDWSEPPATHPTFAEARADTARAESERGAALDAAERYVRVCLETLNGFRPASHLRALAGTAPLADAVSQLARRRNNGPMIRRLDRLPPALPSSRRPMRFGPQPPPGEPGPRPNAARPPRVGIPSGGAVAATSATSAAVDSGGTSAVAASGASSAVAATGAPRAMTASGTISAVAATGAPRAVTASGATSAVAASGAPRAVTASGTTSAVAATGAPRAVARPGAPSDVAPIPGLPSGGPPANAGRFSAPGIGRAPRPASPVPAPFRLKRLRHSSPRPGVAEIVAILGHTETTVACAIRMELTGTTWRPTLIQVI